MSSLCDNRKVESLSLKPLVVGVSGVTGGGKTTLCKRLQQEFPSKFQSFFKQDDYFYLRDSPYHVPCPGISNHSNWDIISSLDMKTMVADVEKAIKELTVTSTDNSTSRALILLDGFLLFDDPRMLELCELKFFITLSKEVCWERRLLRNFDPPDVPGYFDLCVWPMYEQHVETVKTFPNINFIDGTKKCQQTFENTKNMIEWILRNVEQSVDLGCTDPCKIK